jgi:hypothetical protein
METNDESSNPIVLKLKEFSSSIRKSQPTVFCVKCGSTEVDQNAIYKLRCINCGNFGLWDGLSFAIARDGSAYNAVSSFENLEFRPGWHKNHWHSEAIKALQEFSESILKYEPDYPPRPKTDSDFRQLEEAWNQFKERMDELLS